MPKPGLAVSVSLGKKKPAQDLDAPDDFWPKPAMDAPSPDDQDPAGGEMPKISMDAADAIISYIMSMVKDEGAAGDQAPPDAGAPPAPPMGGGRMPYQG